MFKRVVKFNDGTYGVRRWLPFWFEYLDLQDGRTWRPLNSSYFQDCKGSLDEAIAVIDKGKKVSKKDLDQARVYHALKGQ